MREQIDLTHPIDGGISSLGGRQVSLRACGRVVHVGSQIQVDVAELLTRIDGALQPCHGDGEVHESFLYLREVGVKHLPVRREVGDEQRQRRLQVRDELSGRVEPPGALLEKGPEVGVASGQLIGEDCQGPRVAQGGVAQALLGRQDRLMLYGTVATTGAAVMMLERMGPMLLAI